MNIETHLKRSRALIDKALDRYLPPAEVEPKRIHGAMRYGVFSGGKRIRPIIALEACRASCHATLPAGDIRLKNALAAGCAVEIVHAYSLMHDDLPSMDNDDFRRGKPTAHKVFGEAGAILAGDALLTLAFNILASRLEAEKAAIAVKELSEASGTYGMAGGQALDIFFKGKVIGVTARKKINRMKTARLFRASAKLGAMMAGAPDGRIRAMAEFGETLGIAFQSIDDIMDGEGASSAIAERATLKAVNSLRTFGKKADMLKAIAYHMLKRRN
ncbi:MAG: polyprenyl synthetase family protein [Candidatus Omnitrophica bacterium]|nr:polyprenyl synthetase family protein [Candidatus Omnitrophota bacterium]